MSNHDKKHNTTLPASGNDHDGNTHGDKSQDKMTKADPTHTKAPKEDPEAKPAVTQPAHKNR